MTTFSTTMGKQEGIDELNARFNWLEKGKYSKIGMSPGNNIPKTANYNSTEKYYLDTLFYVDKNDTSMQGLTFYNGYYYVGFDMGSGNGKIQQYSAGGRLIKDSGDLAIGHAAELAYRKSNNHIYVCNGGGTSPTFVYEVDMAAVTPSIISTLNLNSLGNSALIAIDNDNDRLIVHTSPSDTGDKTFTICNFTGAIISSFTIAHIGVPQGLDYYQGQLYYYTNSLITILDLNGNIIEDIPLNKSGESEGLTISGDYYYPTITVGYNTPNRLYTLRSVEDQAQFHSLHPLMSVNRYDSSNISLIPVYFTANFNTNAGIGTWQAATSWANGFCFHSLIGGIALNSTTITITLKSRIQSLGFLDVRQNFALVGDGTRAAIDFTDPNQILIQFYNASNAIIDPSTIPQYRTISVFILGGVYVDVDSV